MDYQPTKEDLKWLKGLETKKMSQMDLELCHHAKDNNVWHIQQLIDHYMIPHSVSVTIAAERGFVEATKLLLEHCDTPETSMDIAADTALRRDNLQMFETLVECGLDPHRERELYLRYAALDDSPEIFRHLMDHGADYDDALNHIVMAVDYDAHIQDKLNSLREYKKRYEDLFENTSEINALINEAQKGKPDIEALTTKNEQGNTPLSCLEAQCRLSDVFNKKVWQSKAPEMLSFWEEHVTYRSKKEFNIKNVISDINQANLQTQQKISLKRRNSPK